MTVEVRGVKQTLKALRNIDPEARKQFTRDAKRIAKPIVDTARAKYPFKFLSGMARDWASGSGRLLFPYSQKVAQRGIQTRINTGSRKNYVVAVVQKDPAASIVDMAGKRSPGRRGPGSTSSERFIANLQGDFGSPSRIMWPAADQQKVNVEREMQDLLDQVSVRVGSEIRYL